MTLLQTTSTRTEGKTAGVLSRFARMTSIGKKAPDAMKAAVLRSGRKKNEDVEMTGLKGPTVRLFPVLLSRLYILVMFSFSWQAPSIILDGPETSVA